MKDPIEVKGRLAQVAPLIAESVDVQVIENEVWAIVLGCGPDGIDREWRFRYVAQDGWRTADDRCGVSARYLARHGAGAARLARELEGQR